MTTPTARTVLAANLRRLTTPGKGSRGQRALATKAGIGEGTVSRARRGEGNTTVDNLHAIARACRLAAWQLLVPDLDPAKPPALVDASAEPADRLTNGRDIAAAALPKLEDVPDEAAGMDDLIREARELVAAWAKLSEKERRRFKREIEVAALQQAEAAPERRVLKAPRKTGTRTK